jgi:protocatechuate 3,4-dioxygenase beta subunit
MNAEADPHGRNDVPILPGIAVMKLVFTSLMAFLIVAGGVVASAVAQDSADAGKAASRATVEGMVTKEPGSEPVKKTLIELIAENQGQGGNYTAVTDADGSFRIENILPGRYHLFAEHTGLLDVDRHHSRTEGQILTLTAGQEVKDVHIRLQAAAIVRGRVTDEDSDPLPNAEVAVYRQTFIFGHPHWEQAGAERTNDLGEYRIANLSAGTVYVSVTPPPDFRSLIEEHGAAAGEAHNAKAPEKPVPPAYQTTYYPGTLDRGQALPIQLRAGDDFPVNFSLAPSPTLTIRGTVTNLPPHTTAGILLQSHDLAFVVNGAEMHKDGSFIIHDVAPGNYTILANVEGAPVPMMARQSVQVGPSSVEDVRLAPQPGAIVHGHLRMELKNGGRIDPAQTFLALKSVDGDDQAIVFSGVSPSNITNVARDGSFEWKDIAPGDYYVRFGTNEGLADVSNPGGVEDWFVKSVASGGRDLSDSAISINGGSLALDVVVSNNGGFAEGVAVDSKGNPVSNAVVVAVPEARLRGRIDRYRKTVCDQTGHFTLRGLRPGDYTLFAWESVDGESYYSPDFVKNYESQGSALHLGEGERKSVQLLAIPDPEGASNEEQP